MLGIRPTSISKGKTHTHSNKAVLDGTTASFTAEEKAKLAADFGLSLFHFTADQPQTSFIGAGNYINRWVTPLTIGPDIIPNGNVQATLKTPGTYEIFASPGEVRFSTDPSSYARLALYNVTDSVYFGSGCGADASHNDIAAFSGNIAHGIISVSEQTHIGLRQVEENNVTAFGYGRNLPWMTIRRLV